MFVHVVVRVCVSCFSSLIFFLCVFAVVVVVVVRVCGSCLTHSFTVDVGEGGCDEDGEKPVANDDSEISPSVAVVPSEGSC